MDIQEVKKLIGIDYEDDDALIQLFIDAVEETTSHLKQESARVKLLKVTMINELYENRSLYNTKSKIDSILSNMMLKVTLEAESDEE